jgi:hypothetical protein
VTQALYDLFVPTETYRDLAEKWCLNRWETVAQSHISILLSGRAMKDIADWLQAALRS